jgi:histidinol-phosphate aminotransferase
MTQPAIAALLNAHLGGLEEYTPIQPLDVLSERLGIPVDKLIKLDANENPYGPVPAVIDALRSFEHFHIYPDPDNQALRAALAEFTGVPSDAIFPGHGADELLDLLCRVFLAPGDSVINTPPTFGMYSFDARLQGARVIDVERKDDYSIDVDGIREAVRNNDGVKLVFLTTPNNPTGNWLADADLNALLELPVLIVLDEAYVEFADHPSRSGWVLNHDNLVILRTFSKAAGIAGLRLGYGIFPDWLLTTLWKFKQPYNVNVAAGVAGLAALQQVDQIKGVVATLRTERARLYDVLEAIPYLLAVQGSQANFILCHVEGRNAKALKMQLEQRGILVRHYAKTGLDNCIRISVGRPEHTDALRAALAVF